MFSMSGQERNNFSTKILPMKPEEGRNILLLAWNCCVKDNPVTCCAGDEEILSFVKVLQVRSGLKTELVSEVGH